MSLVLEIESRFSDSSIHALNGYMLTHTHMTIHITVNIHRGMCSPLYTSLCVHVHTHSYIFPAVCIVRLTAPRTPSLVAMTTSNCLFPLVFPEVKVLRMNICFNCWSVCHALGAIGWLTFMPHAHPGPRYPYGIQSTNTEQRLMMGQFHLCGLGH